MTDQFQFLREVTEAFSKFIGLKFKIHTTLQFKKKSSECIAGKGSSSPLSAFNSSEKKGGSLQTGMPACCQRKLIVNI